jgi:hypothetical protein
MNKLCILAIMCAAGCGTDSVKVPDTLPDLHVPAAPAADKGWQFITPVFENVEPAMDYEVCTWTDIIADKDIDIRSTLAFQNEPPGHHVILYYTNVAQPPGTQRVCNETDMASFRFLAGAGGEGLPNMAPGNLVYRIPKGAQIVINHHYLNSTDFTLSGQSAVNVYFAGEGSFIPAGNAAVADTSISVPQGASSWDINCTFKNAFKFWYMIPHMHQWGKHINVDITAGGVNKSLFNLDWDPSFAFSPPEMRLDPSQPLVVQPGDKVHVHCDWDNTAGRTLDFGFEMCVAFGETVDDQGLGNIACDGGDWGDF